MQFGKCNEVKGTVSSGSAGPAVNNLIHKIENFFRLDIREMNYYPSHPTKVPYEVKYTKFGMFN